jgi:hypothetical protein
MQKSAPAIIFLIKAGLILSAVVPTALVLGALYRREASVDCSIPDDMFVVCACCFFYSTIAAIFVIPLSRTLHPDLRISYWYLLTTLINVTYFLMLGWMLVNFMRS